MYIHMHTIHIKGTGHEFEGKQRPVYGKFRKEEKDWRWDVILLLFQ